MFAAMASALSIAPPPRAVLMCSRTKMRTADERLRTLRLPGIGGLETVGPLDLADQLADGDATFDGGEPELIPDRVFNNDTGWAAIGAHASTIAVLQLRHGVIRVIHATSTDHTTGRMV